MFAPVTVSKLCQEFQCWRRAAGGVCFGTDVGDEDDMSDEPVSRGKEVGAFLLLTAVVAPALTIAIVGGYGFVIWMIQIIAGPPGPPPG